MRLLLISLDAVYAADAKMLLSLPALGALADSGVFCEAVDTVYPTLTYPVHASILSGCYPQRHGILHNQPFAPDLPASERAWHWDAKDIQTPTLIDAAANAGREIAAILWPTTGHHRGIRYNFPEALALPGENQVLKMLRYGSAGWILKNEWKWGRRRGGTGQPQLDRYAALLMEQLILRQFIRPQEPNREEVEPSSRMQNQHMPDVMLLHLTGCDGARHRFGMQSEESRCALVELDRLVGRLLAALKARGALASTVVAVVSDHGQADVAGTFALDEWLMENGLPARAQTLGMGAYIHCARGETGRVGAILARRAAELNISRVYDWRELAAMGMHDSVQLAVEAQDGIEFVDHAADGAHRATHGFGLDHPGAQCLLWLAGPPFLQGMRLAHANIVDIAPTLAQAIRLPAWPMQGQALQEAFV